MRCETHDIMLSPDGKCLICQRGRVEIAKDESTPVSRALANLVHIAVWTAVLCGGYYGWRWYTERASAQSAESRAAVREDANLRGRSPGEMATLLREAIQEGGVPPAHVHTVLDEIEAIQAALDLAAPGDLVVALVEKITPAWEALQARQAGNGGSELNGRAPAGVMARPQKEVVLSSVTWGRH